MSNKTAARPCEFSTSRVGRLFLFVRFSGVLSVRFCAFLFRPVLHGWPLLAPMRFYFPCMLQRILKTLSVCLSGRLYRVISLRFFKCLQSAAPEFVCTTFKSLWAAWFLPKCKGFIFSPLIILKCLRLVHPVNISQVAF